MNSPEQGQSYFFSYDDNIGACIVEAVAWFKGTKIEALDPLHRAIDMEALEALFQPSNKEALLVTFSYAGCDIQVHSEGNIIVQERPSSVYDRLDRSFNILVLETTSGQHNNELCTNLLRAAPYAKENVLSVRFPPSAEIRRSIWNTQAGDRPANIGLITVGYSPTSESVQTTETEVTSERFHVDTIPDPSNLRELRIRING